MRRVAREATLVGLHRRVLEDERAHGVGVALGADRKLSGSRPHLVTCLRPMRIVAVAALDQSRIDAMAVRPGKFGFLRAMASIAELGLRFHQQEVNVLGAVGTMTVGATDAACQMLRLGEVLRLQTGLVTLRANRCRLLGAQLLEANDLGHITAAINVSLTGAVASLASVLIAFEKRGMRCAGEVFVPNLLMARLANIRRGVLAAGCAGKGRGRLGCGIAGVLLRPSCSAQAPD